MLHLSLYDIQYLKLKNSKIYIYLKLMMINLFLLFLKKMTEFLQKIIIFSKENNCEKRGNASQSCKYL